MNYHGRAIPRHGTNKISIIGRALATSPDSRFTRGIVLPLDPVYRSRISCTHLSYDFDLDKLKCDWPGSRLFAVRCIFRSLLMSITITFIHRSAVSCKISNFRYSTKFWAKLHIKSILIRSVCNNLYA